MSGSRKLGRGLNSLLATRHAAEPEREGGARWVAVDQLVPNRDQPRKDLEKGLDALAESIRRHGVMQPILVAAVPSGGFEILAGERRWRAAKLAGMRSVPVLIRDAPLSESDRLELALIENIQREDLNPIERAVACRQLLERYSLTQEEVAARLGLERSTVANLIRLLDLPAEIQGAVSRETISAGHARALLRLNGHPQQAKVLARMVREGWSVRQAEEVCAALAAARPAPMRQSRPRHPPWVQDLQERVTRSLGMRSEIRLFRKGGGQVVLHFQNLDELDRFAQRLSLPSEGAELLGRT